MKIIFRKAWSFDWGGGLKKHPGAKPVSGQDHLTDAEVDLLQRYCTWFDCKEESGELEGNEKSCFVTSLNGQHPFILSCVL